MTKEEVGLKVKELRQKTGKSQEELGKALNRSHVAISYIERGKTDLSVSDLYKIADFFGVPVSDFLERNQFVHGLSFTQFRDAKDITPEEKKAADRVAMDFIKYARELAEEKK